ncbi:MAG: hypothetical protein AAFQ98_04025 [Bacteroidota bacterium]
MKKAMIISALFFVALNVAHTANAQAFKAALFNEEDGIVKVMAKRDGHTFDLIYQVADEEKVKVNIVNDEERVVFTEVLRDKEAFRRKYNLDLLPAGQYTFEVTGKYGKYTQRVSVL